MRLNRKWVIGGMIGVTGLLLGFAGGAYSQRRTVVDPLNKRLAAMSGVEEEAVAKVLKALGPTLAASMNKGGTETVEGLGTFKVVRIPEHRDLAEGGRPITVPAANFVVFTPDGDVVRAANAEGITPAETVPQFQYNPLKDQTPSQKTPKVRVPKTRTR
jgi:nucleoid DNA-binding protein